MDGGFVSEVVDLVTARGATGNDRRRWIFRANLREETAFTDLSGNIEVLFRITEGPRHAAAAGVEVDNG